MSDENVVTQEQLVAAIKKASDEAKALNIPNPAEALYAPGAKVRILNRGTDEWEERQKRDEQWRRDNPRPKLPPVPYHVRPDSGDWEQKFATEQQLAERRKAEDVPLHTFKAVVDPVRRRWAVKSGGSLMTKFFSSDNDVILYCRRMSKGQRSIVEFYKAPGQIDDWLGDDFGDYINSESW